MRPVWLRYALPPPLAEEEAGGEAADQRAAAGGDAALRELLQLDEEWMLGDALLVRQYPYPYPYP